MKFKISENDNIEDLHGKANNLFPKLTIDALDKIKRGEKGLKQNEKMLFIGIKELMKMDL